MKLYVFVDKRYPEINLVVATSPDIDLELEKIEVDVEDGQDVIAAVKAVIASR